MPSKDEVYLRIDEKISTTAQQILMTKDTGDYTVGRIQFVVDCQPLSSIVCAETLVLNKDYIPIVKRIFSNLDNIIQNGGRFQNQVVPVE